MSWWILKKDKKTGKLSWISVDLFPLIFIIMIGIGFLAALVVPRLLNQPIDNDTEKDEQSFLDELDQQIDKIPGNKISETVHKAFRKEYDKNMVALIGILKDNNITLPERSHDLDLKDIIDSLSISVDETYRINVLHYIDSDTASSIIQKPTSNPETINWYIYGVIFLENNLIFANYEDGHIDGGRFLAKVDYSPEKPDMAVKILWNEDITN